VNQPHVHEEMVDHLTPSPFFYSFAQRSTPSECSKGAHTMARRATIRPLWLILLLLVSLGAKGCPTYVGCGVSGSLPHGPQGASADTWSCQVGMQIAKDQSVTTPQQAKQELLAMKDQKAVQVASLRDQLKNSDSLGFGGKDVGSESAKVENQLKAATQDVQRLDAQVDALDQLQPPPDVTVLTDGTWTMHGDKAVFQTQAPYEAGKKYVIPYVLRSEHGKVVETGYLPVESVQVESTR
jgi:hypothetical protein